MSEGGKGWGDVLDDEMANAFSQQFISKQAADIMIHYHNLHVLHYNRPTIQTTIQPVKEAKEEEDEGMGGWKSNSNNSAIKCKRDRCSRNPITLKWNTGDKGHQRYTVHTVWDSGTREWIIVSLTDIGYSVVVVEYVPLTTSWGLSLHYH